MKTTIAAQEMLNALAEVTSINDLATIIGLAERDARSQGLTHVATAHIRAAMAELVRMGNAAEKAAEMVARADFDSIVTDYDRLAEEEPTSQYKDSRDAAELAA